MAVNSPIWLMSSAFPAQTLPEVVQRAEKVNAQGVEVCVFRHEGTRVDHIATHIDYENFGPEEAQNTIDLFNGAGQKFSIGAYENLIGGDAREANQNHLLNLIRMAALMGGDENDIKVGTFVGYNYELGVQDGGFEKNLEEYARIFGPIIKYAEDLGVTVLYENCPMEGWRPATIPWTLNNLPCTLAARKLMYGLIPSKAHGETYDPSHDVWQNTDPCEVIRNSDMDRIIRVHIKGTRMNRSEGSVVWGGLYPQQAVSSKLAEAAGTPVAAHDWDRHHYEATLPGFGGSDSIDWRAFIEVLLERGFAGPFVIENEAALSKQTGDMGAIMQGFQATILSLSPLLWPLKPGEGYQYDRGDFKPLQDAKKNDIPGITIDKLL